MSTLNVIDISDHQAGISLPTMFEKNPDLDAVIVKATEGTGYVNKYCDPWVQWLIKNNKPWGFYHYLSGTKDSGAVEADYFYKHCLNYFGHGIAICDLEGNTMCNEMFDCLNRNKDKEEDYSKYDENEDEKDDNFIHYLLSNSSKIKLNYYIYLFFIFILF